VAAAGSVRIFAADHRSAVTFRRHSVCGAWLVWRMGLRRIPGDNSASHYESVCEWDFAKGSGAPVRLYGLRV
jgi:hypothetical protein